MEGIWESLVKSVKRCLKVIIRDKLFTAESLAAFIFEVESIINQRPIVPVSDDVNDFEALKPNHFIIESDSYNFSRAYLKSKKSTFAGNGARSRPQQTYSGTGGNENTCPR